jgi:UDP-glucose:(heptosyl)LPS alpha-1,3-glucosyltransferase
MKLALIRRQFSPSGGAELYLERLIQSLAARGAEIHLFSENWRDLPAGCVLHKVEVIGSRANRPVAFAQAVKEQIQTGQFDCVLSLERTLEQDIYRAGDGVHKVWLERRREFSSWWKRLAVGRGAFHRNMLNLESQTFDPNNTRHIIVNSEMVKREILSNFQFPAERIHLVRNGIDLTRFCPADKESARKRFGLNSKDYVLLFVGSGWERKGLKYITNFVLPALNQNGDTVKLLVVGKGNTGGLKKENVVFGGVILDAESAYRAADLFVFLPIYEPSANVCFEALASGLPVITCKQNGASEVIENGRNGTVLERPDCTQEAISAVNFWRKRAGEPVTVQRQMLSLDRNVDETMAVIDRVVSERNR